MKERLRSCLAKAQYDVVLLTSLPNVIYASEFEVPYFGGFMSDMSQGLPMVTAVLDMREESVTLIASEFYRSKLKRAGLEESTVFFSCFSHVTDYDPAENYKRALREVLSDKRSCSKAGIEYLHTPHCAVQIVRELMPGAEISDVCPVMEESRRIKTPGEIQLLERAAHAADAAQNRLVELSREPRTGELTELEVWYEVQKAVSRCTGEMNPFYGELVTGPRTGLSDYPLGPTNRIVERGDIAIMDIGPRVDGYWSDCSNAVVFWEEPNEEQLKYFRAVKDAYEAGRDAIRPGNSFREVNHAMESAYKEHGFCLNSYLGHQIGVNVNEKPRFTLFDDSLLEENMVVCIEPQLYTGATGETGVRLERMLHVTSEGARELNQFVWGIEA